MATTATSEQIRRLALAHRDAEAREAAKIAALVVAYYRRNVQIQNESSVRRWIALVLPKIMSAYDASAARGAAYGDKIRALELGNLDDGFRHEKAVSLSERQVETSLMVTGVKELQKAFTKIDRSDASKVMKQAQWRDAAKVAERAVGGATLRHSLNGGRDSLLQGVLNDPEARGHVRVTKGEPCYFCAMLASRGPVYQDDSFEDSDPRFTGAHNFKVHDECKCGMKGVYSPKGTPDALDSLWMPYQERWDRLADDYSGRDLMLAFRAEHEGRPLPAKR